jgi:hypothetical protein
MRAMVQVSHFLYAGEFPECRVRVGAVPDATRSSGYWATDKANSVGGIRLSQETYRLEHAPACATRGRVVSVLSP